MTPAVNSSFRLDDTESPGTCYQVIMTALNGSKLTAFFKLK